MKTSNIITSLLIASVTTVVSACEKKENASEGKKPALLESYTIKSEGIYPEGIDFDTKNNRFVISSFNKGIIYTLTADGKTFTPFITDANLVAALGVYTDEENNRIIVASGDAGASEKSGEKGSTAGKVAYLGIYNAQTGALLKSVDLQPLVKNGGIFLNDIAVDQAGTIYITDSFSPNIYKVDKNYTPSLFLSNAAFGAPAGTFGLNGIVYHPDGYLIVAHSQGNKLLKIDLAKNDVKEISGITDAIEAPDGLEWRGKELVVIENGLSEGKIHMLSSTDGWATASKNKEIAIGKNEFPTTAVTAQDGTVYVINSYLGKLLGGDNKHAEYQIKGFKF